MLAATLPLFLRYSQELRDYGLLLLATALAFLAARRLAAAPERWGPALGLAAALSAASAALRCTSPARRCAPTTPP